MAFLSDLFDSFTNQQATPQQTIIPTTDLLNQGYSTAIGLFPQVTDLNNRYQQLATGNQLASEAQTFGGAANQVQRGVYDSILGDLNRGFNIPPELQDLITTNTLQQLGSSGVGASDAGKIFGARSLYNDANQWRNANLDRALGASRALPSSSFQPGTIGVPDAMGISNAISGEQAARDQYANVVENTRRENFSNLINTGGRILGTVAGGVVGAFAGNPAMGAIAGGEIGGRIGGKTGVAGYGTQQQQQGGGGGGLGGFTSILSGLGTQGNYGRGSGGFFGIGANQYDAGADAPMSNYSGIGGMTY